MINNNYTIRQANGGYVVVVNDMKWTTTSEYVFKTLEEVYEFLANRFGVQYELNPLVTEKKVISG